MIKDPFQDINSFALNNQDIEFGVNLLDIERESPVDDVFTVLLPIGKDKDVTIKDIPSQHGSKFLVHEQAVAEYGRIIRCEQWSEIESGSEQELYEKAVEFLNAHAGVFSDDLTIKAVDLHLFDPQNKKSFRLYDKIACYSSPHDLNGVVKICLAIEYDLQNPENNSYRIGTYIPSDSYKKGKNYKKKSKTLSGKTANNTTGGDNNKKTVEELKDGIQQTKQENAQAIGDINSRILERRTSTETIQVAFNPNHGSIIDLTPLFEAPI